LIIIAIVFTSSVALFFGKESMALAMAGSGLLAIMLVVLFQMKRAISFANAVFNALMRAIGFAEKPVVNKMNDKIRILIDEFSSDRTLRQMPALIFTSVLVWIALYLTFYLTILAFRVDIEFAQSVVGSTGGVLAAVLPINSFGSLGTLEAGWAGGFIMSGMDKNSAIITGFGYHIVVFISSAALAIISLALKRAFSDSARQ
jgi:uncharacterized membrane protein YbhN (UPF0104 family)